MRAFSIHSTIWARVNRGSPNDRKGKSGRTAQESALKVQWYACGVDALQPATTSRT